jgi:TolB-like protein/class 3 adenylate cyclase/Tfp pilus assembly protein PilF
MQQPVERRLAAILAADVAGYSRLVGADEEGTLYRLRAIRAELVDPKIAASRGRVVKTTGDGLLAEFASVVDALRCATDVQAGMAEHNAAMAPDQRIEFRIGIHQGDIVAEDGDIFGDGVNVAARLEALAEPGGICVSSRVQEDAAGKLTLSFVDKGEQTLKNIARPVRVYAINGSGAPAPLGRIKTLRRLITAASTTALLCIAMAAWWAWPKGTPPGGPTRALVAPTAPLAVTETKPAPRLSVVVLPFNNLSNDPEQEYFADAITDDLTTDLSRISGSFVIARNTAFTYRGKSVDVKQIGRELGVRYVLEGSVRQMGEQVQVNVQLIDAESGAHLWADRFETDRVNLAQAQEEITGRLARTLRLELLGAAGRQIERESTADSDARDLVMRGWAWVYRPTSPANRQEARRAFEQALTIDSGSVDARVGLASVLSVNLVQGLSSTVQQDQARAEQLLLEALERDPNNARAHEAMAWLRRSEKRWSEAKIEFETALALDRNNSSAAFGLGETFRFLGQPEAAIPYIEKAIKLSPRDPVLYAFYYGLGTNYLLLGETDKAVELLKTARSENPRLWYIHLWLAGALAIKGDLDDAKVVLAEAIRLKPEMNSLKQYSRFLSGNSDYMALRDKTLDVGLRRAGFPEE